MNCKLCGRPTGRFLHVYHQECLDRLHSELAEIDEIIALYESGEMEHRYAKARIVNATSTDYIQKFFWNNIYSRTSIRTYDHLVYSQSLIEVFEEKNRCRMERTPAIIAAIIGNPTRLPTHLRISTFFGM